MRVGFNNGPSTMDLQQSINNASDRPAPPLLNLTPPHLSHMPLISQLPDFCCERVIQVTTCGEIQSTNQAALQVVLVSDDAEFVPECLQMFMREVGASLPVQSMLFYRKREQSILKGNQIISHHLIIRLYQKQSSTYKIQRSAVAWPTNKTTMWRKARQCSMEIRLACGKYRWAGDMFHLIVWVRLLGGHLAVTNWINILVITTVMLGKAFSIALIILGLYILGSFIANIGRDSHSSSSDYSESLYHIGCYESNSSINQSEQIMGYITNLSNSLAPFSVSEVRKAQAYADGLKVDTNGANSIAQEFKKYIVALQNIKNLNEYEQSYNKGIRDARDDFAQCRSQFLSQEWDCNGSYQRYLESEDNFTLIKSHLVDLISKKFEEQRKIESLLEPDGYNEKQNEEYQRLLKKLDEELSFNWELIKELNESLTNLENREFRENHELVMAKTQLDECERNMNQISICHKITEEIKKINNGLVLQDIQQRINFKKAIIERYESSLAKCIKLGLDSTEVRSKIRENKNQLYALIALYGEADSQSRCADQLIFKCSPEQMVELQKNITTLELSLNNTAILKGQTLHSIDETKKIIAEIDQRKAQATLDYQNSIGSLQKIKEIEAANLQKLRILTESVSSYNRNITDMQALFSEAEQLRSNNIHELDQVLKRVGELTVCLAKKDYLLQLQSKRPQRRQEDVRKKRKAAEALIRTIRRSMK